ncbi:hypothetical protein FSARC_1176 [Fusarium sarcochroum]|uniref:Uncharacterized protein n=1 Tax=Fusarium sarcochroum TaxID=1208366 RepID=A0A8H4U9K1_9HYPO|nr:hypothetical protein FSARC_1176 [Fusarium sarcochroum]
MATVEYRSDAESTSSVDSFDPPPMLVEKRITREEALEQSGGLADMIWVPGFQQESLKPRMKEWLTRPVFRVLPQDLKDRVIRWCVHNNQDLLRMIAIAPEQDLTKWVYLVKIQHRRENMEWCGAGADILRFYVAELKPLRMGLPETERREIVNRVRHEMNLFADYHDEKCKAMEREKEELLQKERASMDAERSAFLTAFELQKQAMDG